MVKSNEAKETSPFWRIFYDDKVGEEEEIQEDSNLPSHSTQIVIFFGEQIAARSTETTQPPNRAHVDIVLHDHQVEHHQDKGKGIMNIEEPEQ